MQNQSPPAFTIFDDYRPTVAILVVIRWLLLLAWFVLNNYRVEADTGHLILNLLGVALAAMNAYMSWRVITRRPITWRHALALSLADLAMITIGLFLKSGIRNDFYVFYYPALLGFSLMFPRRAAFTMVAVVATLYIIIASTVAPTFSMALEDEKKLAVRIINMVGIVAAGGLITRWERSRRREAVAAERQRAEENLELQNRTQQAELAAVEQRSRIAREIHDGVAQTIYMLNISLEACVELASRGQQGLQERLQSLVHISREALLETRHYIFDMKPLLDGNRSITQMLEHQVEEFRTVTSIPTTFAVSGTEISLPINASAGLYRIVQEGLANVYKHAQASQVEVCLEFGEKQVRLGIIDDGLGFDPGAEHTGNGLRNMAERAGELGGELTLDGGTGRGTRVTVCLPLTAGPSELPQPSQGSPSRKTDWTPKR